MNGNQKLLELLRQGIGWTADVIGGEKVARINANAIRIKQLTDAETRIEVRALQSMERIVESQGTQLLKMAEAGASPAEIAQEMARHSAIHRELKKLRNIGRVFNFAADELANDEVTDEEIAPDWGTQAIDHIGNVGQEELQKIWARLLVQEIRNPGATSKRTLFALRNLSTEDALRFASVCPFVLGSGWGVFRDDGLTHLGDDPIEGIEELEFNNLLKIQDCGLIDADSLGLGMVLKWVPRQRGTLRSFLEYQGGLLVFEHNGAEDNPLKTLPGRRLTESGREIFAITQPSPDLTYLSQLASFLAKKEVDLYFMKEDFERGSGRVRLPIDSELISPASTQATPQND